MKAVEKDRTIEVRAAVNKWVSDNFPQKRKFLVHSKPQYNSVNDLWEVTLLANKQNGQILGEISVTKDMLVIEKQSTSKVEIEIGSVLADHNEEIAKASLVQ